MKADLSGQETLLVVEDDYMIRPLIGRVLRAQGYEVLEADSGFGDQTIVAEYPGPIACLVTDVVMPGMGGADLARVAQRQRPGIKVLYMTGYSQGAIVDKTLLPAGVSLLQ